MWKHVLKKMVQISQNWSDEGQFPVHAELRRQIVELIDVGQIDWLTVRFCLGFDLIHFFEFPILHHELFFFFRLISLHCGVQYPLKMTAMNFFGCLLIGFGPAFAFFWIVICRDPIRVIILIASAFFWLLAALLSSALWLAVIPLREQLAFGLVFSVLFQEAFRFAFYKIMRKAEHGLELVSEDEMYKDHNRQKARLVLALVAGFGFGLCSGAFSLVNVLAAIWGPGTIGIRGYGNNLFFITSAYLTFCTIFLNTCWSVLFYYGLDRKKYHLVAMVVVTHLTTSLLTLLNSQQLYVASLIPITIILCAVMAVAFGVSGGTLGSVRHWRLFKGKKGNVSGVAGTETEIAT